MYWYSIIVGNSRKRQPAGSSKGGQFAPGKTAANVPTKSLAFIATSYDTDPYASPASGPVIKSGKGSRKWHPPHVSVGWLGDLCKLEKSMTEIYKHDRVLFAGASDPLGFFGTQAMFSQIQGHPEKAPTHDWGTIFAKRWLIEFPESTVIYQTHCKDLQEVEDAIREVDLGKDLAVAHINQETDRLQSGAVNIIDPRIKNPPDAPPGSLIIQMYPTERNYTINYPGSGENETRVLGIDHPRGNETSYDMTDAIVYSSKVKYDYDVMILNGPRIPSPPGKDPKKFNYFPEATGPNSWNAVNQKYFMSPLDDRVEIYEDMVRTQLETMTERERSLLDEWGVSYNPNGSRAPSKKFLEDPGIGYAEEIKRRIEHIMATLDDQVSHAGEAHRKELEAQIEDRQAIADVLK